MEIKKKYKKKIKSNLSSYIVQSNINIQVSKQISKQVSKQVSKQIDTRKSLINEDEYIHFIQKIKNQKCVVEYLINYYKSFNNNYPLLNSNKQIQYFIIESFKNNYVSHINRFIMLLFGYMSLDNIYSLIHLIKNNSLTSDSQIFNFIKSKKTNTFYKKPDNQQLTQQPTNQTQQPTQQHKRPPVKTGCTKLEMGFEKIYDIITIHKQLTINDKFTFLDFGCGDGRKTLKFQSMFDINIKNTYGTDIAEWGPYSKNKNFKFNFKELGRDNKIDYPDNTFDLVNCILCLHHIPNLIETLKEIKRVLKPNGHLLLIDHNVFIDLDTILIDIQHNLYTYINNEKNTDIFNRFFNYAEWDYILDKLKYKYTIGNDYSESVNIQVRFDFQFYRLYQIIK